MTAIRHPLIGQRVHVADEHYTGLAIVLEYDPNTPDPSVVDDDRAGPFYSHLLDNCHHKGERQDDMCDDPADECIGEDCRGWYAIREEGS